MYELYEVVIAQRLLSEKVRKGTRGTVLMAFTEPSVGYMVEFVDNEGNSLDVLTVKDIDITKLPKTSAWMENEPDDS